MISRAALLLCLSALSWGGMSVSAQAQSQPADPPPRVFALVVYGEEPCPKAAAEDEIVVCARKPEAERYRIPKDVRRVPEVLGGQSWASRVESMEEIGRVGRPNSCSAVGSNGQTGCTMAMLRQWFDERRMQAQISASVP